jgi:hypothetical protein
MIRRVAWFQSFLLGLLCPKARVKGKPKINVFTLSSTPCFDLTRYFLLTPLLSLRLLVHTSRLVTHKCPLSKARSLARGWYLFIYENESPSFNWFVTNVVYHWALARAFSLFIDFNMFPHPISKANERRLKSAVNKLGHLT